MDELGVVSIAGSGFGREAYTSRARFGGCLAPADPWTRCRMPKPCA